MSPPGATSRSADSAATELTKVSTSGSTERFFLPNFCEPRMVLAVVLLSELLALTFSLIRPAEASFLVELARISLLLQWLGMTSAALLCALRHPLNRVSTPAATVAVLALVVGNVLLLSVGTVWVGEQLGDGMALDFFPTDVWPFAARNILIGLIVTALLLRYFFVSHQWRQHVESEAKSRIDALQARIRPHFLFNSMNTIASLTRSDPARAEEAVEDLADLFRATLSDAGRLLSLKEELELTRIYQRIEMLRLGERLQVKWDVAELPMRARIPALSIQPLLENAIYHGIEPLPDGGTVLIQGRLNGDEIEISVSNPVAAEGGDHKGNSIAMNNIRERLELAFDGRAGFDVTQAPDRYEVSLRFPVRE